MAAPVYNSHGKSLLTQFGVQTPPVQHAADNVKDMAPLTKTLENDLSAKEAMEKEETKQHILDLYLVITNLLRRSCRKRDVLLFGNALIPQMNATKMDGNV